MIDFESLESVAVAAYYLVDSNSLADWVAFVFVASFADFDPDSNEQIVSSGNTTLSLNVKLNGNC